MKRDIPLLLRRFTDMVSEFGARHNLVSARDLGRLERHVERALALADELPTTAFALADVGSGAGFPGVVLAIVRPDGAFTLFEPSLKRSTHLLLVKGELGLDNVTVEPRRFARSGPYDFVVLSRLAPTRELLFEARGSLKRDGVLVATGRPAESDLRPLWSREGFSAYAFRR